MKKISIIILILTCKSLLAQDLTLKDLKIEEFYTLQEAENNILKDAINNVEIFSNEDINLDFTNIKDLIFVKKISIENKIVLVGETHYSKNISNLRNRIFFALNTFDYYPLIIIENPYSITEYSNYYTHIKNDKDAKDFLDNELSNFIYTEDDLLFLNQIRSWNKTHDKTLSIGGSDLEFSYGDVLEKILKPYFYKLKNVDRSKIDNIIDLGKNQSSDFFIEIKPYLKQSKEENTLGDFPFINYQYIRNIVTNFDSTNNAFRYSFDYYRQKSIIRNLTNNSFFGKIVNEKKVMIHGGGEHMKTHFVYPENANFFSEGSYFNNDYKLTRNKTYSIMLECLAYSYGEMKNRKLKDCIPQGGEYNSIIKTFQKGFEKGIINEQKPYFIYENRNEILKFYSQYHYKNQSISLSDENWEKIKQLNFNNDVLTKEFIKSKDENFRDYDKYIVIPASEIVSARVK